MKKIKLILALGVVSVSLGLSGLTDAKPLITAKEAQLPAPTGELKTRGISRGPAIKVVSPDVGSGQINSPFDLKVQ